MAPMGNLVLHVAPFEKLLSLIRTNDDRMGMQCTSSIAYFSMIYSSVKRVGLWKFLDLDITLAQGDELGSINDKPRAVDELPLKFSFEGHDISCHKLSRESHLFVDTDNLFENSKVSEKITAAVDK